MIDKKRTIAKAIIRYKEIYTIPGKQNLEDCFVYLRGNVLFRFRTKDKKFHTVKAVMIRPPLLVIDPDFMKNLYALLTKQFFIVCPDNLRPPYNVLHEPINLFSISFYRKIFLLLNEPIQLRKKEYRSTLVTRQV